MKRLIGLALCVYVGFGRADEFRLEFSKDIVNFRENQADGLEVPASSPAYRSNPSIVAPLPQAKTESRAPDLEPTGHERISPPEPKRSKQALPRESSSTNDFAPLRVSPQKVMGGMVQAGDRWDSFGQGGQNTDAFAALHDEFKLMVGGDVYSGVVWSYDGVRQFNSWLSDTLSQLTFNDSDSIRISLNDQVIVDLADLGQTDIAGKKIKSVEDSHAAALKTAEYAARYGVNQAMMVANFENQSKFLVVMHYLTLSNFLYSIVSLFTLYYGGKFFRFLIKQR
jgi:hypothetical protein